MSLDNDKHKLTTDQVDEHFAGREVDQFENDTLTELAHDEAARHVEDATASAHLRAREGDEEHKAGEMEEELEDEADDLGISQTVITVVLFVAFLSFVVVCLPFYFFN